MYKPVVIGDRCIDVRPPHERSTPKDISLCCVDDKGVGLLLSF